MNTKNVIPFSRRRRAARTSPKMTLDMASRAKTMVILLGRPQHVAAAALGVNQGRISDVVNGVIFPDAPFAAVADLT